MPAQGGSAVAPSALQSDCYTLPQLTDCSNATTSRSASERPAWANEAEQTSVNPTIGVKKLKYAMDGHHTWTPEEIEQFKGRHALGTQARLAFDLLRYTTGRREDAPRLARQNVRDGRIRFRQAKNEHRNPIEVDIPLHPALAESIAEAKVGTHMTFLLTEFGKPFTANGFGNKDWCRQANLPHCSAHGVRQATTTALAEAGATPHPRSWRLRAVAHLRRWSATRKLPIEPSARMKQCENSTSAGKLSQDLYLGPEQYCAVASTNTGWRRYDIHPMAASVA
jgi:hypothetical protein